jgi:UV DNA damage endonuclease
MIRLGLCCTFQDEPIKFSNTTVAAISKLAAAERLEKLDRLCYANAEALLAALQYCAGHGIGCFRVNSQILPLKTHRGCGYALEELPRSAEIVAKFRQCGAFARQAGLRTSFHPDQFVVLNSPRPEVVDASLRELEYQAEVAEWIGADVLNIHGGGAYGNKPQALDDFARSLERLSERARKRLTVENDDKIFTPADLLPLCRSEGLPLVYDVHHHRCHGDGLDEAAATQAAAETWDREPLFHISSPLEGWAGPKPERHHDFIDPGDWPECWSHLDLTVEVEAKAKERAVLQLGARLQLHA